MADRERRMTRPGGRIFVARAQVMDSDEVRRALVRIAHEIVERNRGLQDVVVDRPADRRGAARGAPGGDPARDRGNLGAVRDDRRRVLPGRHRPAPGALRRGHGPAVRPHRPHRRPGRRRPFHRENRPGSAGGARRPRASRARCSLPSWSTAAIGSCRSGRTSSARTCRREATSSSTWARPASRSVSCSRPRGGSVDLAGAPSALDR